ncbi:MAG: exonuclease SbcCD subunit D C-terminal domain-containing protein [Bacteroidales bacterium]|jgi:exonuclease SbcD|nr:exonuclease SbcCD subunit D C-terminal domain-containing protein [Bacteroidales bacterium]
MRILHTADWHLGKHLGQYERTGEHALFLQWLLNQINRQSIDVLIVAGDIFDTGNPSNTALKQYYDFLWQVKDTCCRDVVIVGGNHDSVSTLNAPRDLLRFFNVHVVGGVPENFSEQVIEIKDDWGTTQLVVCAVPFLRDKDIRLSVPGESANERRQRISQGIAEHYRNLVPYIMPYKERHIPVIATGHLFTAGAQASPDSEKDIHVGNLGQVAGDQFPTEFDYVALGHLHRPQLVNRMPHIRYPGSPVPLSFSENSDGKALLAVSFIDGKLSEVEEIPVPVLRRLIRVKGDWEKVKAKLSLIESRDGELPAWIEIQVETDDYIDDLDKQLIAMELVNLEIVFVKQIRMRQHQSMSETVEETLSLNDINPLTVFEKRCEQDYAETGYDDLLQTFREALELMEDRKSR